jgi:hypothetical protein
VIWGAQEFLNVVHTTAMRRGWWKRPSDRSLLACRAQAIALNEDSGNRVVEIAAIFFALSLDERRTWPVPHALPIAILIDLLWEHRMELRTEDSAELGWMRHTIAEGSVDWPTVRAWFIERCRRRP